MTGLPVQVLSSVVGHARHSAMSGHHGAGPEAPDGPGRDADRDRPPQRPGDAAGSDRERHEQPQRDRRVQHVAGPDRVRTGELVRLEVRTARQPARGGVAVQEEVDAERLLQRMRHDEHEHERDREDRHRQGDGGRSLRGRPILMGRLSPPRPNREAPDGTPPDPSG